MSDWEATATQKRESVNSLIPAEWRVTNPSRQEQRDVTGKYIHQFLSPREIEITETDAVGIATKTTTGQWSAVEVTRAFCHRAALAHQLTNCLLEIFFDDALRQAQEFDAHLAANKKPLGPLHGLPISLKDQFHVKGVETTMGYVGWAGTFQGVKGTGKEKVFESELTRELRELGAVLYCKTSVPHTLMSGETNNHIMGYCWNPKNRNLSSGGSSGGEGALIACKGSPIGFGSDIGGSVRIPAAFNGLYGLRPSSGRVPYEGAANSMEGQNTVLSVIGPLATSVESLQLIMQAVLSQQPWVHDPLCVEIPWRKDHEIQMVDLLNSKQPLSFGITRTDDVVHPHPPIARALDIVAKTLENLGHQVIDWRPSPTHDELAALAFSAFRYDGGMDALAAFGISGEPPTPQVKTFVPISPGSEMAATQIHEVNVKKREAQKAYMDYWNNSANLTTSGRPVECVISPVAATAAVNPENYTHYTFSTFVNTLDYTSVVIPVTHVDQNIDVVDKSFKPFGEDDQRVASNYDPELYDGAPVAIQLVGRRFQEEKMLVLAAYLSKALAARG